MEFFSALLRLLHSLHITRKADGRLLKRQQATKVVGKVLGLVFVLIGLLTDLHAGGVDVYVTDVDGNPIEDAVASATLQASTGAKAGLVEPSESPLPTAIIAQENGRFSPMVTAVQVGTAVSFPNRDDILHNVYSFSRAKKFQLPLYATEPPELVVFDRPGVVILGCNIHDWMVAYVYVLESPYFVKTDVNGKSTLSGLPPGNYDVRVQHPRKRKRGSSPPLQVSVDKESTAQAEFIIALKPPWRPQND